ncbi:MAG: maltose alpha-D-glucosyltransferase [Candidatus Rokuibacteriota bacterium]
MTTKRSRALPGLDDDPLWYKDAIVYELHVRGFYDSNGDGFGDFRGLTEKLDYLQELGITAVWLLPFYPSPLRDDGYDIADFASVDARYGTLRDIRRFLREAARRGLRVITELVLNHTSDAHPWFRRARLSPPGSRQRDFYVWSDTPERWREARIIFNDFESSNWSYDPVAKAYFWHRFYSHQPDLNYENPSVRRAVLRVMDFWLEMGVAGLRLDAVPYLYERDGTTGENLPETHAFVKDLRRHLDARFGDRMLLAEANQWPEDAAAYFGDGNECNMVFHFPLMPRLFMALAMEDRFPILDIIEQTPTIPDRCQWALFLRNHDELTLEMVTDQERDYMTRRYADDRHARINLGIRRRLAPLLNSDRKKIELINSLLFSMPGTPVLYYGDEIGMGDNFYLGDRNGVRTPMQWSADRNAGFSRANPQSLYLPIITDPGFHYEAINVEAQERNPDSPLAWTRRMIAVRKRYQAFGRGTFEPIDAGNPRVLAFLRRYREETILVAANLSRQAQYTRLDLRGLEGRLPTGLGLGAQFPRIDRNPYPLTFGPYGFYWFSLEAQPAERIVVHAATLVQAAPVRSLPATRGDLFAPANRGVLEELLHAHTARVGPRAARVVAVEVAEVVPVTFGASVAYFVLATLEYARGEREMRVFPMTEARAAQADRIRREAPGAVMARLHGLPGEGDGERLVIDALADVAFCQGLLRGVRRGRSFRGEIGELVARPFSHFRALEGRGGVPTSATRLPGSVRGSLIRYGDQFVLKLVRRAWEGPNPELELGRHLTEEVGFAHIPPVAGALEYRRPGRDAVTIGVLHGFVAHEGDAWDATLAALTHYRGRVVQRTDAPPEAPLARLLRAPDTGALPPVAREAVGDYLSLADRLGRRTAEFHLALASVQDPALAPEPFSPMSRRSLSESLRKLTADVCETLRQRGEELPKSVRPDADRVIALEAALVARARQTSERAITGMRTRCHGDYRLTQVLCAADGGLVIIDLEGDPDRSPSERRLKHSPLKDVAGMILSFHYAAAAALGDHPDADESEQRARREAWAALWCGCASAAFLLGYLAAMSGQPLLPERREEVDRLLEVYLLDHCLADARLQLDSEGEQLRVPLRVLTAVLEPNPR